MTSNNQSEQSRIAEYQAAQECYIHYDSFTWQVGAVLIAGTFVFWGFLVNSNTHNQIVFSFTCLLVNWLMSIWVLYAEHNREIYLLKLERMRELERSLKMEQHRRFEPDKHITIVYYNKPTLLSGHQLDYLIYTLTSLGGPLIICLREGFTLWLLLPVPFWLLVLIYVVVRGNKVVNEIKKREKNKDESKVESSCNIR